MGSADSSEGQLPEGLDSARPAPVLVVAVVGLLLAQVFLGVVPALTTLRNDFANYYVAGRIVRDGRPLDRAYERDWFLSETRRASVPGLTSFVPQPPPAALLLVPFAHLPLLTAKAAWTLVLVVAAAASFVALRSLVPLSAWLLGLILLLPGWALANAFGYGQPYPLLLLLLCLSLRALLGGRPVAAGLLLAPAVVLKVYGVPFVLYLLWTRRWRAVAGFAFGAVVLVGVSLAASGTAVHRAYLREVLPASLAGRIQDPYSPVWGSASSLAHRLFVLEPDLNPSPAADQPEIERALSRGVPAAILGLALLAATGRADRLRREWAAVAVASLAASALTASYHFVLLTLPVALLAAETRSRIGRVLLLTAFAFAGSPLPYYFARFASGWGNLLAYPRLAVTLGLLGIALCPLLRPVRAAAALGIGLVAGLLAVPSRGEEPWSRVVEARGYLAAEPAMCPEGTAWVTLAGERLTVRRPDGSLVPGPGDRIAPRCTGGTLTCQRLVQVPAGRGVGSGDAAEGTAGHDEDAGGSVRVWADLASGSLRTDEGEGDRPLFLGDVRRPRLSPDRSWVVFESWERGSWDLRAVERATGRVVRLTSDPANELEPDWSPDGRRIVFSSDRRRGLGCTALYSIGFRP